LATTIKHSGLAVKKMIDCGAGVVDADYRGNVGVVLFNFGSEDFHVEVGDRIAQLILEQISMVPAVQVEELTETERGAGGFGSTGVSGEPEKKIARTISPTEGQSN
jgi:deoxyuridine 5'-triphosphate nucleotidohydrolase